MSYFTENSIELRALAEPNNGLRPVQLGAIHSVLAHFSVHEEPALISLPTGYGKTAITMSLPFVLDATRILVLVPSDALRRQTTSHFKELSTLRKLKVVTTDTLNPAVIGQEGRISEMEQWNQLERYDVVVSTPHSISPEVAVQQRADFFDLILVDEAHHLPARTWNALLEYYHSAKFVLLTGTPFRRDRKVIQGKLAYWYPVSKASEENAFGKVSYKAVIVQNDDDQAEIDRSIVESAVAQLREDQQAGYDHRILARAASVPSAKKLLPLYQAAGVRVKAITSHIAKRTQEKIEAELVSGDLDGVICVDMFGEGYDFPKLKIAALHAPHRSLVPTLQFIGRFTRTNDELTGPATLVAPPSRLRSASVKLFKEGVNIADLIDEAAYEQIAEAEADRKVLEVLKATEQLDSDYESVSPLLLQLYAHAQIYECVESPNFESIGDSIGRNLVVVKEWLSDDGLVSLILTIDSSPPDWATSDVLVNVRHDAFLLAYNEASNLCFIGSTRRKEKIYLGLMQEVCKDKFRPISFERTRQALIGLHELRFYNIGLKNTAINSQAESYRTMTGPAAERAITAGDSRAYAQGHFFGSGESGDERETIGASSSSRVWSNRRCTVAEYLDWITTLNHRLNSDGEISESHLDIIQHARSLKNIPNEILGAGWHMQTYRMSPKIRYKVDEELEYGRLIDFELSEFEVAENRMSLTFKIQNERITASFRFDITGGMLFEHVDGPQLEIGTNIEDWADLTPWLSTHPPVFYSTDKSSFQGVNLIGPATNVTSSLLPDDINAITWENCAIHVEFEQDKADGLSTVHEKIEEHILHTPHLISLIYDHRTGEAADYIAVVREPDTHLIVRLYHCKAAGGAPSGGRVGDVYEVAGQMLKSVAYCDADQIMAHIRHRTSQGRHLHPSRFVIGDLESLDSLMQQTPMNNIRFEVFGVQPGISEAAINDHLSDLMAFGVDYVKRGGAAAASWIVSP